MYNNFTIYDLKLTQYFIALVTRQVLKHIFFEIVLSYDTAILENIGSSMTIIDFLHAVSKQTFTLFSLNNNKTEKKKELGINSRQTQNNNLRIMQRVVPWIEPTTLWCNRKRQRDRFNNYDIRAVNSDKSLRSFNWFDSIILFHCKLQ